MRQERPTTGGEAFGALLFIGFVIYVLYVSQHFINKWW